ncbi:MAG: pyridoxal phosphate-dependent aminotransferase [Longimicrobiales bacterium]
MDLSDNTNLFGVPPAAEQAIRDATPAMSRYPSAYAEELRTALAAYAGVDRTEIVTGCGSDDVLDSAIRAFSEPGDRIAFPDPSFAMIPIFARMNGLDPIPVPLTPGLDIDPDALLATGARIIYLCSPNNPTGTIASQAAIDRLVERAPGVVILDEAYAEFAYGGCIDRAPLSERLLVVRTMSKAFGLAGLRIGYAAGPARLVAEVEKSRGPYKVSGVAERAAIAAVTRDLAWMRERVAEVRGNRARLAGELERRGLIVLSSRANFLLVVVDRAVELTGAMRARAVAVRPFSALGGLGAGFRVTIGPWPMMQRFLAALDEALA